MTDHSNEELSATDHLVRAIFDKNLALAKQALLDGADVNRIKPASSKKPLWMDHIYLHDYDEKNREAFNSIWQLIIPKVKGVTDPDPYSSDKPIFYQAFYLRNTNAAALILLAAIIESGGDAKIDLGRILMGYGDATDPYHRARQEAKDKIVAAHELVRQRLQNPQTDFEMKALEALKSQNQAYWREPLKFPDLADLPMPSQEYINGIKALGDAVKEIGAQMQPLFARGRLTSSSGMSPLDPSKREALRLSFQDAKEARQHIDHLHQKGRAGFIKPRGHGNTIK